MLQTVTAAGQNTSKHTWRVQLSGAWVSQLSPLQPPLQTQTWPSGVSGALRHLPSGPQPPAADTAEHCTRHEPRASPLQA